MIPIVLEELLIHMENTYKTPESSWKQTNVTTEDIDKMNREVVEGSQFDPLGLKKEVWNRYKKGTNAIQCVECNFARVVAILPKGITIPREWTRIFQSFGTPKHGGPKWRVYWFGSITPRRFPKAGLPLDAQHLNGGYTQTCSTDGIFIYRVEEASRVLIHELLHAACQDPFDQSIPQREAIIETWAELIFIAYKSRGWVKKAEHLLEIQCQWVADTNEKAKVDNKVNDENDYAWRYLNGRTNVYKSLGISLPQPSGNSPNQSRFTHPELGD
jgi:hypothetical protein